MTASEQLLSLWSALYQPRWKHDSEYNLDFLGLGSGFRVKGGVGV